MQNSSESNCACKTQAQKPELVKVKEGTSGNSKPNSSLSPCFIEQTQAQSQSVPYRRVSTRSQTDSCTEMTSWLDTKSADDIKFEQNRDPKISTVIKHLRDLYGKGYPILTQIINLIGLSGIDWLSKMVICTASGFAKQLAVTILSWSCQNHGEMK